MSATVTHDTALIPARVEGEDRPRRRPASPLALLRRHWPMALVVIAGAALRVVVMVAYTPFFWFTDTSRYVHYAALGKPDVLRPWGYSGFLWLARHGLDRREIVGLQHALVLLLAVGVYAFLVHRRVAPWLAALSVVPLALSPLVVNLEHHLLSDWMLVVLTTAAALLLAWSDRRPALWACALAGVALAVAIVTRQVALVLVVPFVAYLLLRRSGSLRVGAFVVGVAVPVLVYLAWMQSTNGVFTFSTWSGKMLYARVAQISQCDQLGTLTPQQRQLCDSRPVSQRPGPDDYIWTKGRGPQRHLPDAVVMSFARKVIVHQPGAYLHLVGTQTAELFYPGQRQRSQEPCAAYWEYPYPRPGGCRTDAIGTRISRRHPLKIDQPLAHALTGYQRLDFAIGPAMLACLVITVFALAWRPRTGGGRIRLDAGFLAVIGLGIVVAALATATFSYRYTFPLYSTLPVAAALALTQLRAAVRERKAAAEVPA